MLSRVFVPHISSLFAFSFFFKQRTLILQYAELNICSNNSHVFSKLIRSRESSSKRFVASIDFYGQLQTLENNSISFLKKDSLLRR